MPSDRDSPPIHSPAATDRRRSSFSAAGFAEMFQQRPSQSSQGHTKSPSVDQSSNGMPGPITTAAAQAQRRRVSLTTLGLSGSPTQSSPFNSVRSRGESMSSTSATSASVDESPFEDDPNAPLPSANANPPSPFGRRLSFGARAFRDVRQGNGNGGSTNGRPSIDKAFSPPSGRGRGLSSSPSNHTSHPSASRSLYIIPSDPREGYNFADNLRSRAERTSISGPSTTMGNHHTRAKSVATMEPPVREAPKQPRVPDAFQERILKGDFYMD